MPVTFVKSTVNKLKVWSKNDSMMLGVELLKLQFWVMVSCCKVKLGN